MSILLSGSHIDRDTTCCGADAVQSESVNNELAAQGFRPDKNDPYDYDVQPGVDNSFDMESDLLSMTINYDIAWGEITSITAWNDYDYSVDQDPDRSQLDVLAVRNDDFSGDSFSQELRFTSQAGDNIDYMLGLFYYEQTTKRGGNKPFVFVGDDFIPIAASAGPALPAAHQFAGRSQVTTWLLTTSRTPTPLRSSARPPGTSGISGTSPAACAGATKKRSRTCSARPTPPQLQ